MPWNVRMIRHVNSDNTESFIQLHEVNYENNKPAYYYVAAATPFSDVASEQEQINEITQYLQLMQHALTLPILNAKDLDHN